MSPDEPFGPSIGKMTDVSGTELKNEFSDIPAQNIDDMLQSQRIQPRQVGTGVMRGTQRIVNTDGSYITLGVIPETSPEEFGIAFFSSTDTIIFKLTGETIYFYNKDTGDNNIQLGTLTNGESGAAFAKDGEDLVDALGS